jgi:hypothetical protein
MFIKSRLQAFLLFLFIFFYPISKMSVIDLSTVKPVMQSVELALAPTMIALAEAVEDTWLRWSSPEPLRIMH